MKTTVRLFHILRDIVTTAKHFVILHLLFCDNICAVSNKQAHFLQIRIFFCFLSKSLIYPHFLIYTNLSENNLENARSDQTCFFNVVGGNTSLATKNFK